MYSLFRPPSGHSPMMRSARKPRLCGCSCVAICAIAFKSTPRSASHVISVRRPIEPGTKERDGRAQIDLVVFTLLKAYLAMGRLDDVRRLFLTRRGSRGIPVAGLETVSIH